MNTKIIIKAMDYHYGEIITVTIPCGEPHPNEITIIDSLEQPLLGISNIQLSFRPSERNSELAFVQNNKTRTTTIIDIKPG